MWKQIFSQRSQSAYTLGKYLNLLPFELFNHVKAGRLHPVDKDTGQPIPRPDVLKIKKRLKEIEQEIKVSPLAYGKLQTGKVYPVTHKHPQIVEKKYQGTAEQIKKQSDEWDKKSQQEKELDKLVEKLQEEHGRLNEKLQAITAIDDWTTYDPPEEPKNLITHLPIDLMKAFDILHNARFHNDEVKSLNIETHLQSSEEPDNMPPKAPEPVEESAPQPENYFKRTDNNHWAIKFGNEIAPHVDHVDGLLYIAHILGNQGKDISDQTLYQLAKRVPLKETIDKNEMTELNLSKGFRSQSIGTDKGRKICQAKYHELKGQLETASLEEQDEIKEAMKKLLPYLNTKTRNFADPNDKKAQSNLRKRIDLAYDKLKKEKMPALAKHLKDTIKTGYYGRRYVGPVTWEIKI